MIIGVVVEVASFTQHSVRAARGTECYSRAHLRGGRGRKEHLGHLPTFIYAAGEKEAGVGTQHQPPGPDSHLPYGLGLFWEACEAPGMPLEPRAPGLHPGLLLGTYHSLSMHCLTVLEPRSSETSRSSDSLGVPVSSSLLAGTGWCVLPSERESNEQMFLGKALYFRPFAN